MGQESDFRQAVDHHALRLEPLNGRQNALNGLAKLEIRRVEQALVLIRIGGNELEDCNRGRQHPTMRTGSVPKFLFGFGQAHVNADLAYLGARHQELQRNRGLSRARAALEQMQPVASEPPANHVVEANNSDLGSGQE